MSIQSITKRSKEVHHFRTPHESYVGKKLNHCPNCAAEVYWARDKDGYEYWICTKCGEQYLFQLPLDQDPTPRKKWWLPRPSPTPTTNTNVTPLKPETLVTLPTPTRTPESSAEGEHHTYEREEQIKHALRRAAYLEVPKNLPTMLLTY